jgi:serine/threonine-protein kinase RsbW
VTRPLRLTVPAASAWVVLVRTTAVAVCARLDYDVDTLEDVRLAVDEVASLLVADAVEGSDLVCELAPGADSSLAVTLSARTRSAGLPPPDSFAWAVLSALVDDVEAAVDGDVVAVVLRTSRRDRADA